MSAKPEAATTGFGGRSVAAVVAVVLGGAIGALILGEYEFTGVMPYAAGLLFGMVLGEIAVAVSHRRGVFLGAATALAGAGGLLWAAWISSGEGLRPLPVSIWPAVALAAMAGGGRAAGVRWGRVLRSRRS